MYRRTKFLEVLLEIRQEMAREADYDVDLFAEIVRSGKIPGDEKIHALPESTSGNKRKKSEIKINR
ncbi:MAG TPA: hypothetical protein VGD05_12415 [Pyrinomonadaceae bacterium]|jgi:hypothetical protein